MEKLNLYNKKSRVVSFRSATIFLLIMLLPAFGSRVLLEYVWRHEVEKIRLEHAEIIRKLHLNIRGREVDITNLDDLINKYDTNFIVLVRQKKDIIQFLKSAYFSKRLLSEVMNNFERSENDWIILTSLDMDSKKMNITLYEIYTASRKSDGMVNSLKDLGTVKEDVLFDVNTTEGKKMSKVVINFASH